MVTRYNHMGTLFGRNTRGAAHELLVSSDLLLKGYEVFRAVSPASSCDLLAIHNGKIYRVEVKTGYKVNDKINVSRSKLNPNKYDILAIVFEGEIVYEGL